MSTIRLSFVGAGARRALASEFYTRRVLQRCERGELSLLDAAELLMSAAAASGTRLAGVAIGTPAGCAFTRRRS
jgi:hypothetical protein